MVLQETRSLIRELVNERKIQHIIMPNQTQKIEDYFLKNKVE